MRLRKSLNRFFDRYEISWELFMIALAVVFVMLGFLPDYIDFSTAELAVLEGLDWGLTIFFALEFTVRILISPSRMAYFKGHWLDLVAIVPMMRWLRVARFARILRLLRIARMARVFRSLDILGFNLVRFVRLNGLQWILLALTAIMLISSIALYFLEQPVNEKIKSYWDALYASLVTWTTPGYGDIAPVTTGGHILGLVLIISGLVTWGILIANLAAFLSARRAEDTGPDPAIREVQHKLVHIDHMSKQELVSLRGSVIALIDHKIGEEE